MDLLYRSKQSPFYLEPSKEQAGGVDDGLSEGIKRQKTTRAPLTSVMTLVTDYYPEELYTTKEARWV